jgi:hypothetical protein
MVIRTYELHRRYIVSILKVYNTLLHCAIAQQYDTLQLRGLVFEDYLVNVKVVPSGRSRLYHVQRSRFKNNIS